MYIYIYNVGIGKRSLWGVGDIFVPQSAIKGQYDPNKDRSTLWNPMQKLINLLSLAKVSFSFSFFFSFFF